MQGLALRNSGGGSDTKMVGAFSVRREYAALKLPVILIVPKHGSVCILPKSNMSRTYKRACKNERLG